MNRKETVGGDIIFVVVAWLLFVGSLWLVGWLNELTEPKSTVNALLVIPFLLSAGWGIITIVGTGVFIHHHVLRICNCHN